MRSAAASPSLRTSLEGKSTLRLKINCELRPISGDLTATVILPNDRACKHRGCLCLRHLYGVSLCVSLGSEGVFVRVWQA